MPVQHQSRLAKNNSTEQFKKSAGALETQQQLDNSSALPPGAVADPSQLTPSHILQIQRTAGNRAVQRLLGRQPLQAQLPANQSGQKANRLARQVTDPSPTPKGTLKLRQITPSANNGAVIQRIVLNLDPEPTIDKAALIEQERQGGKTQIVSINDNPSKPLANLDSKEDLAILGHGVPAYGKDEPKVANRTAKELFKLLKNWGLKNSYSGLINLSNCTTAWDRKSTGSFAESFLKILVKNKFQNRVKGFESFASSESVNVETEIALEDREIFLAQAIGRRCIDIVQDLMDEYTEVLNLKTFRGIEKNFEKKVITNTHKRLGEQYDNIMIELKSLGLANNDDKVSKLLISYYYNLAAYIFHYLKEAQDTANYNLMNKFQEKVSNLRSSLPETKTCSAKPVTFENSFDSE